MRVCVCGCVIKCPDDVMNKDERDEREREREREREKEAEREVWRLWILRSDPHETFTDVGQIRIRSANAIGISQMLKRKHVMKTCK